MTDSSDPCRTRFGKTQLEEAENLFDDGNYTACLELAKKSLSDLNLPKYYVIQNCLLVACSLDSWLQADVYIQAAQQAYWTCHENATEREDEESLEILEGVREQLDEVLEWKKAALAKFITPVEDEDNEDDEDEDEEEGDVDTDTFNNEDGDIDRLDESQTAAEAENEVDVAAETFELPIRSASKSPNSLA